MIERRVGARHRIVIGHGEHSVAASHGERGIAVQS
jgi:hypothetical protein